MQIFWGLGAALFSIAFVVLTFRETKVKDDEDDDEDDDDDKTRSMRSQSIFVEDEPLSF